MAAITITRLSSEEEVEQLDRVFAQHYRWYQSGTYYAKCLAENGQGTRITLLAYYDGQLAGCCHLLQQSAYPYFRERGIPEINDLNVFPAFRRKKIASAMFAEFEAIVAQDSPSIGVGVGLYADYGNAQSMYAARGYVPDGQGATYKHVPVEPGKTVMVDDDLVLYLIKSLQVDPIA